MAGSTEPRLEAARNLTRLLAEVEGELLSVRLSLRGREPLRLPMEPELLQQCIDLCTVGNAPTQEPIRTIHHFACTGGTLISRCLGAMPNVLLLSELDPLSTAGLSERAPGFAPTDLIRLARQSNRPPSSEDICEVFLAALLALQATQIRRGRYLVLRDHAHSQFCVGPREACRRPALREIVATCSPLRSVVTVRHPLDSYVSLVLNRWERFEPGGVEEYAFRYIQFLSRHEGLPIVRYEDVVSNPSIAVSNLCDLLDLPFSSDFERLITAIKLTGDSGRSASSIGERAPRPERSQYEDAARRSSMFRELLDRLGYAVQ
jgi:hypothetical protein